MAQRPHGPNRIFFCKKSAKYDESLFHFARGKSKGLRKDAGSAPMRNSSWIFWTILLSLLGSGCMIERSFIFFPDKTLLRTPADAGLAFEDLFFPTADGVRINAWFIPSPGSRKVLLWFHGNAGNMGNRVELAALFHRELKINLLMIDFRGYGRSGGRVTEKGTYQDALAAYDHLLTRPDIEPSGIIVYGQSLGAAVAVELAVQRSAGGLILEGPFVSIREMAKLSFPWLPVGRLLSTQYEILSKVARVRAPLLLIHGDEDEVVPYEQGRKVFEAARPPKILYTVHGGGHNDLPARGGRGYIESIGRFIERPSGSDGAEAEPS